MDWTMIFQGVISAMLVSGIIGLIKVIGTVSRMDVALKSHENLDTERFARVHSALDGIQEDVRDIRRTVTHGN